MSPSFYVYLLPLSGEWLALVLEFLLGSLSQFLCGVGEGEVFKRKGFDWGGELTMV